MERKSGRSKTEKKNGQKWVEVNYAAKQAARKKNGGELPYTPALVTSDHPISRNWSTENLPEILFYLHPPTSQHEDQDVKYLMDEETGEIARSDENNEIKDFEILPRYISLEVEGWMVEAWRRLDSRITYEDIRDRQRSDPDFGGLGLKKLSKNALQNHCRRDCRKVLNNWVEYGRRDEPHRTEVETIEELTYENIAYNTVLRRSEEFPHRLVKVRFQRRTEDGFWYAEPLEVTGANVTQTTFCIHRFEKAALPALSTENYMTKSMDAAWEMSLLLQERARKHGKQHWSKLNKQCLPVTWFDRVKREKRTAPNPTYDGGCAICTWTEGSSEGFESNKKESKKRKLQTFVTPNKRSRAASDSNSDEPLMTKLKRVRLSEAGIDSDYESEDDEIPDESPVNNRHKESTPISSTAFTTPVRTRRTFYGKPKEENEYDAGVEDYDEDEDATQGLLSSEGSTELASSRRPYTDHQFSPPLRSMFESPLAPYSSSPYQTDETWYQPAAVRVAVLPLLQPTWLDAGFGNGNMLEDHEWPRQTSDQGSEMAGDQHELPLISHEHTSFNSANTRLNSPFSSNEMHETTTAATSFESGGDLEALPYGLQQTRARLQRALELGHIETHASQMSHYHPGRTTAQGAKLSDVYSSPPSTTRHNFDIMSPMYSPGSFVLDNRSSRRHSIGSYTFADETVTPYGHRIETDDQWRGGDIGFVGSHLAEPSADQFIEDDSNDLPAAPPVFSRLQPQLKSTGFLELLSSDPVMPEYQEYTDMQMTDENQYDRIQTEYETIAEASIDAKNPLQLARQTPPLLDYY